ncbi:MAG TPA: adenosylcobinamide amidohydrolase [Pilimelia sp.]|nr:adenosylcobinamide amidohydrolase [Pilimelia sp.]
MEPTLTCRREGGREIPVLVWRLAGPALGISSGPLGGGLGVRRWVLNATVPMSYARDDPDLHLADMARGLGLDGPGAGLLTGVDVADAVRAAEAGVTVWATVGVGAPIQAAAAVADPLPVAGGHPAGTINVVAFVPARLSEAALVNTVATATEAKVQALRDLGIAGTGTATDAVCVLCAPDGPAMPYGGPRSAWGAPLARAVYAAVREGAAIDGVPWSERVR